MSVQRTAESPSLIGIRVVVGLVSHCTTKKAMMISLSLLYFGS